jgi:hypothetical protein
MGESKLVFPPQARQCDRHRILIMIAMVQTNSGLGFRVFKIDEASRHAALKCETVAKPTALHEIITGFVERVSILR